MLFIVRMIFRSVLVIAPMAAYVFVFVNAIGSSIHGTKDLPFPTPTAQESRVKNYTWETTKEDNTFTIYLDGKDRFGGPFTSVVPPTESYNLDEARLVLIQNRVPYNIYKVTTSIVNDNEIIFQTRFMTNSFLETINGSEELKLFLPFKNLPDGITISLMRFNPPPKLVSTEILFICTFLFLLTVHFLLIEVRVIANYVKWGKEAVPIDSWFLNYLFIYLFVFVIWIFALFGITYAMYIFGNKYDICIFSEGLHINPFTYCLWVIFRSLSLMVAGIFIFIESALSQDIRFFRVKIGSRVVLVEPVAKDEFGILYNTVNNIIPFSVVEVVNSTPSHPEHYYIPVPAGITTPKGAIAWTFGLEEKEYEPMVQT